MAKEKSPPEAEKMRRRALARWENEGGADPCGPQVPGVAKECGEDEEARGGDSTRSIVSPELQRRVRATLTAARGASHRPSLRAARR
jgi:hypothetical protein